MNNIEQTTFNNLKSQHQLAVDLRASGARYEEIATQINTKQHTIRTWFMKGGICYEAYEEKKRQLRAERQEKLKQVEDGIADLASGALEVLKEAVEKKNLKAAITIMEMAGFKAIQKVQDVPSEENEVISLLREIAQNRQPQITEGAKA